MQHLLEETSKTLGKLLEELKEAAAKSGDDERRAAANAADAVAEAQQRVDEIHLELKTRDADTATEASPYRWVGIYAMRNDPDHVIFDVDLDTPRAIGERDEYDCIGSLPLELDQHNGFTRVRRRGDNWLTEPAISPPGGQDCAIEVSERRHRTMPK